MRRHYGLGAKLALSNAFNISPILVWPDAAMLRVCTPFRYGSTDVRFVGVSHLKPTFEKHRALFVEDIQRADAVVVEADSVLIEREKEQLTTYTAAFPPFSVPSIIRQVMQPTIDRCRSELEFFEEINALATAAGKPVFCFEPLEEPWKKGFFHTVAEAFADVFTLTTGLSERWPRLMFWGLAVADLSTLQIATARPSSAAIAASCFTGLLSLSFIANRAKSWAEYKTRNVLVIRGILDTIRKFHPATLTVIYGGLHTEHFLAYLKHPGLFARHAKNCGVDIETARSTL